MTGRRRPTGASATPFTRTRLTARQAPGTAQYERTEGALPPGEEGAPKSAPEATGEQSMSGPNDQSATRPLFALPTPQAPAVADQPAAEPEPLADDASVDLAAERAAAGVDAVLDALDGELVGLPPVKTRIRGDRGAAAGRPAACPVRAVAGPPSLHMCFTGNPGTGKTTVALRMAELLHRLGYLRRGHVVSVTRDDLVGQYVGHTAPKTKEVLKRAMGGVLFIDEAYYLYRAENERDYGEEAIEILLQYMENHRDDLVVILAGYADRMETFFASNPGMSSRDRAPPGVPRLLAGRARAIGALILRERRYRLRPRRNRCSASTSPGG